MPAWQNMVKLEVFIKCSGAHHVLAMCSCAGDAARNPVAHKYWKGTVAMVTKCWLMNTEEPKLIG